MTDRKSTIDKYRSRIRNVVAAAGSDPDPWLCMQAMKRKLDAALADFPFMVECPACGHEAFWLSTKKHRHGRHVCFSLSCDWTSTGKEGPTYD